ncbi:MAG: tyrosine--tRNA ligase [Paracoccaceae bacterium]
MKFRPKSDFMRIMLERGFYNDCTGAESLDEKLKTTTVSGYIGFDATAKSLHVGSLTQIMMLYWLQECGHKPIVLMGGGTTKIGDPSFRNEERALLSEDKINENITTIKKAFSNYINFDHGDNQAIILNNSEWLDQLNYIEMLRKFGSQFTIGRMLTFESVKQRLEREQSLSFLEFNYMILQAIDFLELKIRHNCILQMGGSDQWGNIVNGIELIRRIDRSESFGLTSNLLTNANGKKMGKTQSGAVWINEDMLNSFDFWQYWRNTDDKDVFRFLKLFTTMDIKECERLGKLKNEELNEAKVILATAVTRLAHGEQASENAKRAAYEVFSSSNTFINSLPKHNLSEDLISHEIPLFKALVLIGFCNSNKEAKRLISENGARVNDEIINNIEYSLKIDDFNEPLKISAGKKRHVLVTIDK